MDTKSKTRLLEVTKIGIVWGILGTLWFISGDTFSISEKIGAGVLLLFVVAAIVLFIESTNLFHFFMVATLIILATVLLGILIHHYWFLYFVWLALPFTALWLSGNIMRNHLSLNQHKMARGVLVGSAIVLAFINLVNAKDLQFDIGKRFIDGYQITIIHDCQEYYEGDKSSSPETCKIDNLSEVAWYWRVFLGFIGWGSALMVLAGTVLISNSTVNRKAEEDWHRKHPDGKGISLVKND